MSDPARQADQSQQDEWKQEAATAVVEQLKDGMIIGLGSGSTAQFAVDAIGKRVRQGLTIIGVSTSEKTADQARRLGIPLSTLADYPVLDLTIDGADEVANHSLDLIKGGGGNLLREKIVATASKRLAIVVDNTKIVEKLGAHPLPVEVVPFGWQTTEQRLSALGAKPILRCNQDGSPYVTDGGHYILDCAFGLIDAPDNLAKKLDDVVGVVEHGLFIGLAWQVTVAGPGGVKLLSH
ncbi:MAG TPA: ribose-5-phosphate isomerase RpiA [Bryobacteraceae bacterium]|jgi:ribose 5-phosphate isomerase A|nr:ribose-5-phosphate isomerase RpiA [Bryobacteraceae bacterium]